MRAGDGFTNARMGELSRRAQMHHATFPLDIKSLTEAGQLEGLAAGYGNRDAHDETFAPGAFSKSIAATRAGGRRVAMLLHHNPARPCGRWDTFAESKTGLSASGALALEVDDGREAYALLKAGALAGLSVGFRTLAFDKASDGSRIITEAELLEVSLVSTPSNPSTYISAVKGVHGVRDLEEILRSAGMPSRRAKAAATAAWRAAEGTIDATAEEARAAALLSKGTAAIAEMFRS